MILESSDIKNGNEFYKKLKNNLNPVIPDKLKRSIVRDKYSVVGFIDLKFRKKHLKDTKGNRLAKKKRNKIETFISPWSEMIIKSIDKRIEQKAIATFGRSSYPPGGVFFRNEMDDLLTPKPVEFSEECTTGQLVMFNPSINLSKELIDGLNASGKEGVSWLDEASDMADAFAYYLKNRSFLEQQRKYIRENGVMEMFNDFDIIHNTIAVVSYSRRMYDEFIESYPDYLRPAFIRIYEPNQHKGRTFTDYHVLDCPNFLSKTAYDIKYYVRRPFTIKEIYNFRGFRFLIKPKTITLKPLY